MYLHQQFIINLTLFSWFVVNPPGKKLTPENLFAENVSFKLGRKYF